jgi:hypothetical protein
MDLLFGWFGVILLLFRGSFMWVSSSEILIHIVSMLIIELLPCILELQFTLPAMNMNETFFINSD